MDLLYQGVLLSNCTLKASFQRDLLPHIHINPEESDQIFIVVDRNCIKDYRDPFPSLVTADSFYLVGNSAKCLSVNLLCFLQILLFRDHRIYIFACYLPVFISEEILKPTVCLYHPSVWPDHNDSKRRVFKELGHQFIIALLFHLDHKMVRFVCGSGSQEGSVLYSEPVEVEMIRPYPFTFGL